MKKPNHIHDVFVKRLLSQRDVAEAFLQEYLPAGVVQELDFKTMTYENTSYLSKDLSASFSDMVWRIGMIDSQRVRVSILLEHKSYADPVVAFQMLEYLALGYKKQLENKQELELIIPFCITTERRNLSLNPSKIISLNCHWPFSHTCQLMKLQL